MKMYFYIFNNVFLVLGCLTFEFHFKNKNMSNGTKSGGDRKCCTCIIQCFNKNFGTCWAVYIHELSWWICHWSENHLFRRYDQRHHGDDTQLVSNYVWWQFDFEGNIYREVHLLCDKKAVSCTWVLFRALFHVGEFLKHWRFLHR